mgnify:FL=1|jgi:hypothetical protein
MKSLVVSLLLYCFIGYGQISEPFDSFDNTGEWTSPGGNTGSHAGDLCFNITGNYLAGEFYVFQSPIYDFSTWSSVELLWSQESDVRNGDVFGLYFYDNGWFFYDISNLDGFYSITLPNTTIALAFVLNTTGGSGNINGKFSHVRFLDVYDPAPLPVELLDFSAEVRDDGQLLEWSTASEFQSDYFSVYRSDDGNDWDLLSEIPAAGFSNSVINYEYMDRNIFANYIYYKLKQTDIDGAEESFIPVYVYRGNNKSKNYNMLGQEVKESYKGFVLEVNGNVVLKKIKN